MLAAPDFGDLTLHTLGDACVRRGGAALHFPARSAEELLWYLHANEGGAARGRILSELWGQDDGEAARGRFRVALHRLRGTLGHPAAVTEERGLYRLHPGLRARSDTEQLRAALAGGPWAGAVPGPYLPGVQEEWADGPRRVWAAQAGELGVRLAQAACAARRCVQATEHLRRTLGEDPLLSEQHHQQLMTCLNTLEGPASATEHYRRYCQYLQRELGDTPLPATAALAARVRAGEGRCAHTPLPPRPPVVGWGDPPPDGGRGRAPTDRADEPTR